MSTDKMREEFEAWLASRLGGRSAIVRVDDGYLHWETEVAWQSWQASREALVVELPPCPQPDLEDAEEADMEMFYSINGMHHAFRAAIEASGVRVKE